MIQNIPYKFNPFPVYYNNGGSPEPPGPDPSTIPLTFTGKGATNAVQLHAVNAPDAIALSTSKNGDTWTAYTTETIIELASGDTLAISGNNDHFSKDGNNYYKFAMTGTIEAEGNVQSLMNFSNTAPSYCYYRMFASCTSLISVHDLSATTLANSCYSRMFLNCSNLSTAPILPATTLATYCYFQMFLNCTNLSTAPLLSATTLADRCYQGMFRGCSNLSSAPLLPATTLAQYCYDGMFLNCINLSTAPSILPATTLTYACYDGMFGNCINLSTAPILAATSIGNDYCCYNMFYGCTKLSSILVNFTAWSSNVNATVGWLQNVAANGTFTCPTALGTDSTITRGVNNCPNNWTVVNK